MFVTKYMVGDHPVSLWLEDQQTFYESMNSVVEEAQKAIGDDWTNRKIVDWIELNG